MAELESSLTDIGWLNQKLTSSKHHHSTNTLQNGVIAPNGITTSHHPSPNDATKRHNATPNDATPRQNSPATQITVPEHKKPLMSYATLILRALQTSKTGRLSVSQIYQCICHTHPYFNTVKQGFCSQISLYLLYIYIL